MFRNIDLAVIKQVPISGRLRGELRAEILNAFNWVNFVPVTGAGAGTTTVPFEVTQLNGNTPARVVQLTIRITW